MDSFSRTVAGRRHHSLRAVVRRFAAVLVLGALALLAPRAVTADTLEYEVKAAMLYNFIRFVEWPSSTWKDAKAPLVVGVLGSDPFGRTLDQMMQDKNYSGRPIQVRRLRSAAEVEGCHLLFIAKSEKRHVAEILRAVQATGVLTVSDLDEFVQQGGAIGFVLVDSRIRFEINTASASKSGLTVSSKLLRLAIANDRRGGN